MFKIKRKKEMADQGVEDRVRTAQIEARARNISHNVRCLECGHQSIEESAADIAFRLRKVFLSLTLTQTGTCTVE